jgi:hypothetical protein
MGAYGGDTAIPFASKRNSALGCTTDLSGHAANALLLSYVGNPIMRLPIARDGTIVLTEKSQSAFCMPFQGEITSLCATIVSVFDWDYAEGIAAFPYVQLYTAAADSNVFYPLLESRAVVADGYWGANSPANDPRPAFATNLRIEVQAGNRILIVGGMEVTGAGRKDCTLYWNYTGGVAIRPTISRTPSKAVSSAQPKRPPENRSSSTTAAKSAAKKKKRA